MQVREKQLEEMSQGNFSVFMETSFPTLKSISVASGALGYSQVDEDGEQVIQIGRGSTIDVMKLPQTAIAKWSNTKNGAETVDLDWEDSISSINTKVAGKYEIRGKVMNLGIYNPCDYAVKYTISIDRGFVSLSNWYKNGAKIEGVSYANFTKAEEFEEIKGFYVTQMDGAFDGMTNLESFPDIDIKPSDPITSLTCTYRNCKKLVSVPNMDTSNVTNFDYAFSGASSLTDISNVDMSSAQTLKEAFKNCASLTKVPSNIGNCTDFTNAFANATSIEDLSYVSMFEARSLNGAFQGCTKLTKVPLNTQKCTDFTSTFLNATSLTDLSDLKMTSATKISYAFKGCTSLSVLPNIRDYAYTDYLGVFYGCSSLPKVLPTMLNMTAISDVSQIKDIFGGDCSVEEVSVKIKTGTDVYIPRFVYPAFFGANIKVIHVYDSSGNFIKDRKREEGVNITYKYLESGTYTLTIPEGVTSVKVAAVSGATINVDKYCKNFDNSAAKINKSSFGNKVVSLDKGIDRANYVSNTSPEPKYEEGGYGYQPKFGATYNEEKDGGYGGGVACWREYPAGYYSHSYAWPKPSLVEKTVSVTPFEKVTITVGEGSYSGDYAKNWHNAHLSGFVLVNIVA